MDGLVGRSMASLYEAQEMHRIHSDRADGEGERNGEREEYKEGEIEGEKASERGRGHIAKHQR